MKTAGNTVRLTDPAVREASKNWKSIHHWKPALQSFQVMFGEDHVPMAVL